jgi:hypothetical protein
MLSLRRDEEVVWELKAERILQYQGSSLLSPGKWIKVRGEIR